MSGICNPITAIFSSGQVIPFKMRGDSGECCVTPCVDPGKTRVMEHSRLCPGPLNLVMRTGSCAIASANGGRGAFQALIARSILRVCHYEAAKINFQFHQAMFFQNCKQFGLISQF